jgi:hypothetical protein
MNNKLGFVLFLMLLFGWVSEIRAVNVDGYIVTAKSDTVYGIIQLSMFDQAASGIKLRGAFIYFGLFDQEASGSQLNGAFDQISLSTKVYFKKKTDRSFKAYSPEDIAGFGFNYRTETFTFRQMEVPKYNMFQRESKKKLFLCLVYEGYIELYKYSGLYENMTTNADQSKFKGYTDFYLYNHKTGLVKVEQTDKVRTVRTLLQPFNLDEKFAREIPDDINFRDIKQVLVLYDKWLIAK